MTTSAQLDLRNFLGRKNFKGLYTKNPLARTPEYHKFNRRRAFLPSYPIRPKHQVDRSTTDWPEVFAENNISETRQPFLENPYTKPNRQIGSKLRSALLQAHTEGRSLQQISFNFGISVPRIDAIVKLDIARQSFEKNLEGPQKHVRKDVSKLAKVMSALFEEIPTDEAGVPRFATENLTEIPMPKETRTQMFQTIAESEPFGPVDAAEVLGIEPAKLTLDKLTDVEASANVNTEVTNKTKKVRSFFAQQLEGERHLFRFTDAKVGKVGYHYGAARDDQKPARRVRHLPDGRKTYPLPEHS